MLQRNTGAYPRVLPTLDPPQTVAPGDTIDHPQPLAGFEAVPAEPPAKLAAKAASPASSAAARPAADVPDAKEA